MVDQKRGAISPPPYTPETGDGASSPRPRQHPIPADIKPTNFIEVSEVRTVDRVYTIDPGLTPPASLMSPRSDVEDRKGVRIESQDGDVNVHLFVLPSNYSTYRKVFMVLNSWSGSVRVNVHDAEPQNVAYSRLPISMSVKASMKKADVYIPRSFKGPLHLATAKMGKVYFSKDVKAQITHISSIEGVRKCFIGEYRLSDYENGGQSWPGDELNVEAKDAINLYYDDEGHIPTKDTSEGGCIIA